MLNKKQKSILGLHGQSMPRSKQLTKNAAIFSAISKFFPTQFIITEDLVDL